MTAIDWSSTVPLYGQGKSAMIIDGDYNIGNIEKTGVPTGVFAFPRSDIDLPWSIVNATGGAWALNSALTPEKKKAALDFIDMFMLQDIAKMWYESGISLSVKFDASDAGVSELHKEFNSAVREKQVGFFLDNSVPGLLDVFIKQSQSLLLGEVSPEKCWELINAEYEKLKAENTAN